MNIKVLLLTLCLSSCSTLNRTMISGALVGGVAGAAGGLIFSPDHFSRDKNAYIGGVLGAIAGVGLVYLLHDGPEKKMKAPMLLDEPAQTHKEVPLFDFSPELKNIRPEVSFKPVKKYEVPLEKLPPQLEGKVKKQFIIEYESDARTLEIDNRTIQISPFKAWEHVYENKKSGSPQLDLFTPFYEIFHELCLMLFDLGKEFIKFGAKKVLKTTPQIVKIERKALNVRTTTKAEDALGIDTKSRKELLLKEIDFRRHSFIVGASGFGKTNLISILQEHSLRMNKPIIFFDPKGDMEALETFQGICRKYDRPCYIFSEHFKDSISLNPILEGTVNQIVDRIMCSFEWSEPYYRDSSRRSLTKALQKLEKEERPFTLKSVFDELVQMESKDNVGLIAKLEAIIVSDFGKILNSTNEGLTLSKIRTENACLYIGLSTQGYGETATAVGKLFLGELLYNSYKSLSNSDNPKGGLENPISIYFDEFGSLVTPEFIELQNKCRGAGMELTLAVQTASDIDRVNPDLTKQVIENAGNLFILKQRLQEGAAFFSEAIGTGLSKKQTLRFEDGQTLAVGSEREVHELLVHPDLVKNLGIGQCVLLRQGPSRLNLINIRTRKWDGFVNHNRQKQISAPAIM